MIRNVFVAENVFIYRSGMNCDWKSVAKINVVRKICQTIVWNKRPREKYVYRTLRL